MVSRIAIIPARGGSKRIPKKNILPFAGVPMIAWTIQAARESGLFERVLVSTDSEEIAEVAKAHGAEVPFLREHGFDDHAPVSEATINALQQAEAYWNTTFEQVVQLMANCPLRKAEHISEAIKRFDARGTDFQISCFQYGWMNPWWAVRLAADGKPSPLFEQAGKSRSQDLETLYCPTGAVWVARRAALLNAGTFYGPDHRFCPLSWEAALDIDDMADFAMAMAVARMQGSVC